jgi:hypothetical protein
MQFAAAKRTHESERHLLEYFAPLELMSWIDRCFYKYAVPNGTHELSRHQPWWIASAAFPLSSQERVG